MKAVLTTKLGSGYEDIPEQRYHFPSTYLRQIQAAVGDFVVYYEPRRTPEATSPNSGRQCCFAVAKIDRVEADRRRDDHYFAYLTDYLDFDREVPFKIGDAYFENVLFKNDGSTNRGAFGRSVRNITDQEFEGILAFGFSDGLGKETLNFEAPEIQGFEEAQSSFVRPVTEVTTNRLFRDRAFVRHVRTVYDRTCAFTGLRIINGGGRPEAQAAHIQPVARSGPDSVRNGLAISSTIHWMFDRGLVSVDDNFRILTVKAAIPEAISRILNIDGMLRLPDKEAHQPHRSFLRFHRENVFKG